LMARGDNVRALEFGRRVKATLVEVINAMPQPARRPST
jgi:hypothetical protein